MAVIESKGDGYSLFNGVKLRSFPEYDTEKYRHVLIAPSSNGYVYMASSVPYTWNGLRLMRDSGHIFEWSLDNDTQQLIVKNYGDDMPSSGLAPRVPAIWSNYDIINTTDNSVYLAASEPISLDGMNVIEWDGDTTGLAQFGAETYYLVSAVTDLDVDRKFVLMLDFDGGNTQVVTRNPTIQSGFYSLGTFGRYVNVASETHPLTGLYLVKRSTQHASLFAYYPLEEETENSTGKDFLLHQMFPKGIAFELTGKIYWMQ